MAAVKREGRLVAVEAEVARAKSTNESWKASHRPVRKGDAMPYAKAFAAGTVSIGPDGDTADSGSMYTIAVK